MKYIKNFEMKTGYKIEFLVCELLPENRVGSDIATLGVSRVNKYAGAIHLLQVFGDSCRITKPEISSTFRISFDDDIITTEYGYNYKILYRTKNNEDAINNYEVFTKAKQYNL